MSISASLAEKRALITGGAQGIGRRLVERFYNAGSTVHTVDINQELLSKLKDDLPGVNTIVLDLSNWEETKSAIRQIGPLDHLVNNAGIIMLESLNDVTESSLTNFLVVLECFTVLVGAVYNVSQVAAQSMIDRGLGGSIVNVSSVASLKHVELHTSYGPMKAAVDNLTKSMAVELMPYNIRVNCILPGLVETPMILNHFPELIHSKNIVSDNMLGKRAITTDEIADLVIFLLSPLSAMITGQGIVIDGGYILS